MEKARLCELDWFHIQPSIPLQMWPAVLGGGRTGFVMLPLPGSETFVHFLQIPSAWTAFLTAAEGWACALVDTKHRTQLWTSSGMLGPCEPSTLFCPSKYLVLQLHALNFICPLTPHRLQFSQPVLVLRQLLISGQPCPLPPHPFSRPFKRGWAAEVTAQTQTPMEGHCYHAAIWELPVFSWPPFPVFQPIICR